MAFVAGNDDEIYYVLRDPSDTDRYALHLLRSDQLVTTLAFIPDYVIFTPIDTLFVKQESGLTGLFGGFGVLRSDASEIHAIETIVLMADSNVVALVRNDTLHSWHLYNVASINADQLTIDRHPEPIWVNDEIRMIGSSDGATVFIDSKLETYAMNAQGFVLSCGTYVSLDDLTEDSLCIDGICRKFDRPITTVGELAPVGNDWYVLVQQGDDVALHSIRRGEIAREALDLDRSYRILSVRDTVMIASINLAGGESAYKVSSGIAADLLPREQYITPHGIYSVGRHGSQYLLRWNDQTVASTVRPRILRRWGLVDLRTDGNPLFVVENNGVTAILDRSLIEIARFEGAITSMATTWTMLAASVTNDVGSELHFMEW